MASLADYANDPAVVAYLKAQQAAAQANSPNLAATGAVPFDAALSGSLNAARTNYQNTIAGIAAQEPMVRRRFGFNEQGQIDPSNPFGKAQLMKRSYDQSQRGTTNSMAARGQLYSGAAQRQKEENQFNYQANDAALRGAFGQEMAGLSAARFAAQNQFNQAQADAFWQWANAQIAARAAEPGSSDIAPAPAPVPVFDGAPSDMGAPTHLGAVGSTHQSGGTVAPQYSEPSGLAALAQYVGTPVEAYLRAEYAKQQAAPIQHVGLPMLAPKQGRSGNRHGGARYGG